jgi:hypothetical protein
LLALANLATPAAAVAAAASTNLTFKADLSVKETYDSNVYLQDKDPDLTKVPQAVRPFQDSFVTSVTPRVGLDYVASPHFYVGVSYAPEVTYYHAEPSEDYVAHRGLLNLGGKVASLPWQIANTFTYVQGSDEGLYFGGPGGAPAIGGIPIRDRRLQFVYRGKASITWDVHDWFFRPAFSGYWHDFLTQQRPDPGYENYIDRRELSLGGDVGRILGNKTRVYAGYRFGYEIQGHLLDSPYHYDSEYHRPLAGIEGQPWKWFKANFAVGPDMHHTIHETPPGFDTDYTTVWADAVVTLMPTAQDSLMLTWKENTQPAFASASVYDDITYDFLARHTFDKRWSVTAGFRIYAGEWYDPVSRDDWIYTASAGVAYKHDAHWSGELAYSYDWVQSKVPNTDGREFTRNLVWLGARYTFR